MSKKNRTKKNRKSKNRTSKNRARQNRVRGTGTGRRAQHRSGPSGLTQAVGPRMISLAPVRLLAQEPEKLGADGCCTAYVSNEASVGVGLFGADGWIVESLLFPGGVPLLADEGASVELVRGGARGGG